MMDYVLLSLGAAVALTALVLQKEWSTLPEVYGTQGPLRGSLRLGGVVLAMYALLAVLWPVLAIVVVAHAIATRPADVAWSIVYIGGACGVALVLYGIIMALATG